MSALALDCAALRCGPVLNVRRGYESVSSSGRFATGVEGQWTNLVRKHGFEKGPRVARPEFRTGARADSAWYAGEELVCGFGNALDRNDRLRPSCSATSTANSDGLTVPGHWGLSDGISKELVTDQEIGVVYADESSSAAADHSGVVRGSDSPENGQRLVTSAAACSPDVREHTQGKTAEGFRVLDEDLAGSGGGIHDDGQKCTNAGPVPAIVHSRKTSGRLAPASLSQSMQAVSGRGFKSVVGVAAPVLNPGGLKGGAGMMAATLTVAGVVGAVSQGANLLQKGATTAPAKVCRDCKGAGRIACDLCQGTGQIRWEGKLRHKDECPSCEGKGEAKCHCKAAYRVPELVPRK
ncbi:hypothetical protein KFL_002860120 [Klebsormidium nitens]|uniref:Uncharacterized protein n=1 Tax=Klebsormidium nitens TaxID=105231 RepID=A0A1Y1IE82_KLENI|nr:hypothetical protein KFL_002860120 [Klebsormidium nitens]|eukprot:GAQ86388.1 hypothetical protein KFL_002860120 [Klebsormidium nitens]